MERLTIRKSDFAVAKRGSDAVSILQAVDRLADIEDILGDDYDLDRMRELLGNLRKVGVERPEGGMRKSNTKKPAFNADAAEEYFSDLLVCYRRTANDIFGRDNDGRHASEQIYSAEYQKYVGMQIAIREVLEYFSKYDLCEWITEVPDERLRELAKADRDGRCEIHMVKDGERVYSIFAYVNGLCPKKPDGKPFDTIAEYTVNDFTRNTVDREFGKTVFLTREAAEAALKGEKDGD